MFSNYESDDSQSSGGESDTEWNEFQGTLLDTILQVESTGSFATSGTIQNFANPGISVDTLGSIRLPLSVEDAQHLVKASHRAPFGNGTETVLDESVRKTWQIGADQVQFHNPEWQACLDDIVEIVARDLGINGGSSSVHAEFYKMLIYEEGAMFKTHRDTEKTPGMFGTLVVSLPSLHTGGCVRLQHGGKVKRFATEDHSAFGATFLAWYADVHHEIEPVQSGYRWVLTYNLVNTAQDFDSSADLLESRVKAFTDLLEEWEQFAYHPGLLIYPLSHQYTDESLRLARLKGEDSHHVSYIAQGCAQSGKIRVLLANMEFCVTDYQSEDETREKQLYLTRITDVEGFQMSIHNKLFFDRISILGGSSYGSRDPDIQLGGGYLGNQHAEIDQIYKDSVVLMVPNANFGRLLLGNKDPPHLDFAKLLRNLKIRAKTGEASWKALLVQICETAVDRPTKDFSKKDFDMGSVAVVALSLREASLFAKAVENTAVSFGQDSYKALGRIFKVRECPAQNDILMRALMKNDKLHQTVQNLNSFQLGFAGGNPDRKDAVEANFMRMWQDSILFRALAEVTCASGEDAKCLVDIAVGHDDTLTQFILHQGIHQFATRFSENVPFSLPCAIEIAIHLEASKEPVSALQGLFDKLVEHVVSHFDLQIYATYLKKRLARSAPLEASVNPFVSLYKRTLAAGSHLPGELLEKIQAQADHVGQHDCKSFLPGFVDDLLCVVNCSETRAQNCVNSLLTAYTINVVGHEPKKPSDWLRLDDRINKCYDRDCEDCPRLHEFLGDADMGEIVLSLKLDHLPQYHFPNLDFEKSKEGQNTTVKKTLRHWTTGFEEWNERVDKVLGEFSKLPSEKLRECLGRQYDDVMALKIVRLS